MHLYNIAILFLLVIIQILPEKIVFVVALYVYTITNWLSVRSAVGDILTFVDTRWYTLKFVSSTIKGRFRFRSRTLLFEQCVENFYACTKCFLRMSTNCPYAEGSFTERNANGLCVGSTLTIR